MVIAKNICTIILDLFGIIKDFSSLKCVQQSQSSNFNLKVEMENVVTHSWCWIRCCSIIAAPLCGQST
jgi:hypothetical protein